MKIALVGCGNLVNAIVRGFFSSQPDHSYDFYCYTPSQSRAMELAKAINGNFCKSLDELKGCDVYLLGFKPQNYSEASGELKKIISGGASLWSLLAGTSSDKIESDFPENSVLRIMPNTASFTRKGISLYHYNREKVSEEILQAFNEIFGAVSRTYFLESDDMIDRTTGVSASGPALMLEIAIQLSEKLISYGLTTEMSQMIVRDLLIGTGSLLEKDLDAKKLKDQVTSKKGVTFEALEVLKKNEIGKTLQEAIDAAYQRSVELRN